MKTITGPSPITHITAFNIFSYRIPQRELFALARLDKRTREALIKRHLGLVHLVAKRFRGMPYEDLVQEGCIGLLIAIERFDPDRGYRFSTYAVVWIRQSISRALQKAFGQIYLPSPRRSCQVDPPAFIRRERRVRDLTQIRFRAGRAPL